MAVDRNFPYTPVPNSLKRLLEKVPTIGAPEKATQEWLASIGFSGGNNARSLAVMRSVGIIDTHGQPTDLWLALRAKDGATFAAGIRKHYADLFATYSDANSRGDDALIAFVRSKTNYADQAQRLAVRTFKVLCEFGDFDAESEAAGSDGEGDGSGRKTSNKPPKQTSDGESGDGRIALTVNLQLQLPASAEGEVYEQLFAAMGKHL